MQDIHGPLVRRSSTAAQSCSEASVAKLPLALREAAFVEAADIFVAMLSNDEAAMKLLRSLAMIWGVPFTAVDQYASLSKPGLAVRP